MHAFRSILLEVQRIYHSNIRSDVNHILLERILQMCCSDDQEMTSLIIVCAALITGLHHAIASEIGGFFLENIVQEFHATLQMNRSLRNADEVSKKGTNVLLLVLYLYNFELIQCSLVYDIFRDLLASCQSFEIELILSLLKHCGYQLRGEDMASFKDMIQLVQVAFFLFWIQYKLFMRAVYKRLSDRMKDFD